MGKKQKPIKKTKKVIPHKTPMPELPPDERIKGFEEVALGYTKDMALKEAVRCLQCKEPRCIDGCPVQVPIPEFIKAIGNGEFEAAINIIKGNNLLPAVCGRVCPQESLCEKLCILGKKYDPVAIGRLERFAADLQIQEDKNTTPKKEPPTGKKVAIVGSGPSGLTCAYDLAKHGHEVTIFEAFHEAGGVLFYGIPKFRLPKNIVSKELDTLKRMGVKIVLNAVIGKLITIDEIMLDFNACFIGTGAGLPKFMGIEGENLNGVYSANEFLTRVNLMRAYSFPDYDTPVKVGRRVAVVGGGNVAMDAVRVARRLGAEVAIIVYRRSEEEMPARAEEVHHAKEEGIRFEMLVSPKRILGDDGWVTGLECIRMELSEPDESGRRRPVPRKGSEFVLPIDTVVIAVGTGANPLVPQNTKNLELNKWGYIKADDGSGKTSIKGVYAGGDIVTGSATVISAMGAGRRAAQAIHKYLMG